MIELAHKFLPLNCRIILLGDGEFDGKRLCEKCKEFTWEYVLRTSKDRKINCGGEIAQIGTLAPENYGIVYFIMGKNLHFQMSENSTSLVFFSHL